MLTAKAAIHGSGPRDRFIETVSVKVKKGSRLAINLRSSDHCVTRIHYDSPLYNKVFMGDKILQINGEKMKLANVHAAMNENKDKTFLMQLDHSCFSWCMLRKTTLENISTEEKEKLIGRAINVYTVVLKDTTPSEIGRSPFGLQIRYDARERIEVFKVAPGSLSATHLRPGDIIREINSKAVVSKSMCVALIQQSLAQTSSVTLTIESPVNGQDSYRDNVEMPNDVVQIAQKQIEFLKTGGLAKMKVKSASIKPITTGLKTTAKGRIPSAATAPSSPMKNHHVSMSQKERTEFEHYADMVDPSKLRSCKEIK